MCMEDFRIGRKIVYATSVVSVPDAGTTVLCQQNNRRVSLMFSVPGANHCHVAPKGVTPDASTGINVIQSVEPLQLSVQDWGELVQAQWTGQGQGGTSTVLVIEGFLEKQ